MSVGDFAYLAQEALLRAFSERGEYRADMRGWIGGQNYILSEYASPKEFILTPYDIQKIRMVYVNDMNRMAMASIETVVGIYGDKPFGKSKAWKIIRLYYASFFAAHCLMRMFGRSCTFMGPEHAKKLLEISTLTHGDNVQIDKGFYCIDFDEKKSTLFFTQLVDSHRDTWKCFRQLVERLQGKLSGLTAPKSVQTNIFDFISNLKYGLSYFRCVDSWNWLSDFRNKVNYQHAAGVWYPYGYERNISDKLDKSSVLWIEDPYSFNPKNYRNDIDVFAETALMLLAFQREMLLAVYRKTGGLPRDVESGCLKMLRMIGAS